ncbi:hypothetical protein SAMN05421874_10236 [Nonomuraea maritima]|uniref:Metalloprotease n=2 Tax=Nonomuraea maritima TaxID=683260 RepID=A0A1G8UAS0_9ACTN|nr:hypothetical protein SAMN05421874_10236 [Nonomuraea maritima]
MLVVSLSGVAAAEITTYPVKDPKLTENTLYATGSLKSTKCTEKSVKRNDRKSARAYFDGVVACLNTTWRRHLTAAGLPFKQVKVRHMNRIPKKYCDFDVTREDSQAWYCADNGSIVLQLGRTWLKDADDLWLFDTAASMYAYHVQNLVGIEDAYQELPYGRKAELNEQIRRRSLQSECLGAAFVRSVWPLKGRTMKDWDRVVGMLADNEDATTYGKGATVRYWLKRGFAAGDPGSCDTWSASSAKVA